MDILGIGIIVLTTVVFTLIGIWYTKGKHFSIEDYLTARGSVNKGVLISTLVASAIGSWVLFSPPEVGVTAGITGIIGYGIGSAFAVMIFAWLGLKLRKIMPKGHSLTEFVVHRFGKGMYVVVLLVMIFYMGVYLTAELTGIALAAQMVFGIPIVLTAIIVGLGTMAYTAAGGLKTSVFTDWVQYWFMIPLIALIFAASVVYLGGFGEVFGKVSQSSPQLFDFGYWPGIEYGITLIIAIIGAELFNQANWQRVYAADSERTMIKSFVIGGVVIIPIIIVLGLFGIFAVGTNSAETPSVALFTFMMNVTPRWILLVTMVLAVILVMSTIDSLLNGLASLFTVDVARVNSNISKKGMLSFARWLTVVIAGIAILIATRGYSVLYLFLVADLVCVAAVFPTFFGMYSKRLSGMAAVIASVLGIAAGAVFFPTPDYLRSFGAMVAGFFGMDLGTILPGNLLISFAVAFIVPAVISVVLGFLGNDFDFGKIDEKVKELNMV